MITLNGTFTTEELKEILTLAENQETTDRYLSTKLHINGNYAVIDADIDSDGDITIYK